MTQQFLNDFRVLAIGVQDGAERMTKRMPTDTLGQPALSEPGPTDHVKKYKNWAHTWDAF